MMTFSALSLHVEYYCTTTTAKKLITVCYSFAIPGLGTYMYIRIQKCSLFVHIHINLNLVYMGVLFTQANVVQLNLPLRSPD